MEAIRSDRIYSTADIEALPDHIRAELFDGEIFYMSAPSGLHQEIVGEVFSEIRNFIKRKKGKCKVYSAPYAVYLFGMENDRNYVEPDITVICREEKRKEKGCDGAPDWIIEVVSPTTASRDYLYKLNRYQAAGVREYWIINPDEKAVDVFDFDNRKNESVHYDFKDQIPSTVLEGLHICIEELL